MNQAVIWKSIAEGDGSDDADLMPQTTFFWFIRRFPSQRLHTQGLDVYVR